MNQNYFHILWNYRKNIAGIVFFASVIAIVVSLVLPKWYCATSVILPPNEKGKLNTSNILGNLGISDSRFNDGNQTRYVAILNSNTLARRIVNQFHLVEKYGVANTEEAIEKYKENLLVVIGGENQVFVSVFDKDQEQVAEITNFSIAYLDSIIIELSTQNARNNRNFIDKRLNIVLDSLNILQNDLSALMEQKGIVSMKDQLLISVAKAAELKMQIVEMEINLESQRSVFSQNNPEILQSEKILNDTKQHYKEFFTSDDGDELFINFSEVPKLEIQLMKIERQIKYYEKLLEYLGPQYEQAKIDEARDTPTLQILDIAVRPERKARPSRRLIVISTFFLSFLFSSAYFILREEFSPTA